MRFKPLSRLTNPALVTGKAADPDGLRASLDEVAQIINEQIRGLSVNEIEKQGYLHPQDKIAKLWVDGWSGFVGRLS